MPSETISIKHFSRMPPNFHTHFIARQIMDIRFHACHSSVRASQTWEIVFKHTQTHRTQRARRTTHARQKCTKSARMRKFSDVFFGPKVKRSRRYAHSNVCHSCDVCMFVCVPPSVTMGRLLAACVATLMLFGLMSSSFGGASGQSRTMHHHGAALRGDRQSWHNCAWRLVTPSAMH